MDDRHLARSEYVAIAGGLLLLVGLFLPWYGLGPRDQLGSHTGPNVTISGWEAHPTMRWLLLLAAVAPLILAWIIYRGHALSWPRGEMTAVTAIAAFGLVAYQLFVKKPGSISGLTHLKYGAFVALLGTIVMGVGAATRSSQTERPRKPPGVI